ncbi:hypothetical protein [uncultured Dubosiella sp.]|uniref:hypothetical protein n=1 Tax=uncultured Dubosiella sp. TaxID=1937011 RepID=UPI00272F2361|nr:hypothetical protein [uncultured Dubosiella sp.]
MTDTYELEKRIRMKGLTKSKVAEILGLTLYGFDLKCKNHNEFKASEISRLSDLLELNPEDFQKIFFLKRIVN